ncbi:phospholipid carrier-dependent glycosyltransferase [Pseudomonas sp. MPFS]|uniref:ArnT family glycosyltransferase n=1 Tax=Pseudomonas sp. MPFS TaxID=2795724 RepID=UPI001F13C72A|nr:phospholipid carrier-dependent glycosyltransferase [Pseudomonas sp. MPFS]UMZ09146.1 phospholipid carrier-dependent glycosyltransferase [Pseudomonas sp. MPFS]
MNALPTRTLWWLLLGILGLRLASLGLYPLMDTSEARYGEMARKMLELGDWVTPMFDYGVPFWGKPPLAFWSQALAMQVLGISEFAVRLPAWLFHVASCLILIRFAREEYDERSGLLAAILFSSSSLGLLAAGVVLTDPALSFSLLLACYGFWRGCVHADRGWALAGFFGLGLGLLAKGPLVLVLVGAQAGLWTLFNRQWRALYRLPWTSGVGLMLLVALPWYLLAESRSPGFLDYFLVGEHWKRYVVSDWAGDLYGSAHERPFASIWLELLMALLPWSLLLPLLYRLYRTPAGVDRRLSFITLWALVTPLFFTFSGNILWTYVLPALPAWCLLLALALQALPQRSSRSAPYLLLVLSLLLPLGLLFTVNNGAALQRPQNQQALARAWNDLQATQPGPLYYWGRRSYSAEFYSAGQARRVKALEQLPTDRAFYLARRLKDLDQEREQLPTLGCVEQLRASQSLLFWCTGQSIRPPNAGAAVPPG